MNIKYHFIASCLLLSGGLAILTGCNSPQSLKEFTVKNPLDINREDEALVLTRAQTCDNQRTGRIYSLSAGRP